MDKINDILRELEVKRDIKILFAVETGNRAWNLESPDSDYNIRFIYQHDDPIKYASLEKYRDKMEGSFNGIYRYDWEGMDIRKAMGLLKEMNPSLTECLHSPIVYKNEKKFREIALNLLELQQRLFPLVSYYITTAKANFQQHIENKELVENKDYLKVIRCIGMVEWLRTFKRSKSNLLEINFLTVLDEIKDGLDTECHEDIMRVIQRQKTNELPLDIPRSKSINTWIQDILNQKITKKDLKDDEQKNSPTLILYDVMLFDILRTDHWA